MEKISLTELDPGDGVDLCWTPVPIPGIHGTVTVPDTVHEERNLAGVVSI